MQAHRFADVACYAGFGLTSDDPTTPQARLLKESESRIDEQVKQAKVILPEMIKAVRYYLKDYLFGGKYGDPSPQLRAACKHIRPNNDAQERAFGIVDYRIKKHPHESIEMTDARQKISLNQPMPELEKLGEKKADQAWAEARLLLRKRKRSEKERRKQYRQAKMAKIEQKVQAEDRKDEKKEKAEHEFKAVTVATTKAKLDALLRSDEGKALPVALQKQILRAQIKQLTGVHQVSKHTLPLTKANKRLEADELYANIVSLMKHGDPTKPETEAKFREERNAQKKPRRGRPRGAQQPKRQKRDDGDEDYV